ncbi:MAG: hypothetical protein KAG20_05770 [Cocleimonas sp.]|nr:hypothetical protein [Cocleimonas sp.]
MTHKIPLITNQYHLLIVLFYSFLSLFFSTCNAADAPSEALKAFYQHINQQQCEAALLIRPDYSIARCKKISNTHIHKVTTELSDNKHAVLLLELDSLNKKQKNYFFGYVRMTKKKGKWLIIGPFKNREDYWLDEYVKTYIPGEFKTLSETIKKKKFIPPPAPNTSPQAIPEESKKNHRQSTPPGDSIDADEFIQQPQPTPPKKPTPENKKSIIKNNSAQAKTLPPLHPEAIQFLLGQPIIEGNYTVLLKKIQQYFPSKTKEKAKTLLIDKSRRTLFIYNHKNLLVAFFPILSSDISSIPSGLYRINSDKTIESEASTTQLTNQPIILKRVQNIETASNSLYYIRDLFDTDTKNSLQLSPIDNKRLQQLISFSALTYIGQ